MAQCLDITLPGAATNAANLPFAEADPRLNKGSLVLWEPGHPADPYVGVPAFPPVPGSGSGFRSIPMPNIAKRSAKVLMPTATDTELKPRFYTNYGLQADGSAAPGGVNVDGAAERTPKGGLHVISAQTTQQQFRTMQVLLPDALKAYILANQAHLFYLSLWYQITRVDANSTGPYIGVMFNSGNSRGIFNIGRAGVLAGGISPTNNVVPVGARNTLGQVHEQLANTWDNTALDSAANLLAGMFGMNISGAYGDYARNKAMSAVLYSIYLEDLTVSGQTFAQAAALDTAQRNIAFGAGGRYNGDTVPTSPSAYP